ncbi:2-hydroxyacid dehydrogenase [Pseudovibrio sp. Tun.PSC04-5.I4]|uniref:2-hydroxyacid dehydrogenase n=1 Tax=Pseudovibrio sp. Tun.PSC04-5.I4 TaxID=1798213 RepID=UPI00087E5C6B|nr:2-hydroxyacid dehydrogenase [Pseudovibrio sp. Tun.PSC04-5.I4]SDR29944.1 Lactate dehydrogenase [Pseudovibrio sp. Tun.PSC04-5.I4]
MIDVLQLSPYAPDEINVELQDRFALFKYWQIREDEDLLSQILPRIRVVATKGDIGLDGDLMAALPNLELITVYGVGFDKIDLDQAKSRGIKVTTTPDALTDAVADHAVALALASTRRVAEGDSFIRQGKWLEGKLGIGQSLRGKTLGILGYGRVGQRVAKIMRDAFDMRVLYCDRSQNDKRDGGYRSTPLELAAESDVLVLAASGNPTTKNIIDINVLEALGRTGLLINIARGSLINTQHLISALEARKLGAAALDVFPDEPNVPNELISSPYTTLTPHLASATIETRLEMGRQVIENISSWHQKREVFSQLNFLKTSTSFKFT